VTAVASIVRRAAPDIAKCPRCITCQSFMQPFSAEYWHIGAITMRFESWRSRMRIGSNSADFRITRPLYSEVILGGQAHPSYSIFLLCSYRERFRVKYLLFVPSDKQSKQELQAPLPCLRSHGSIC